MNPQDPEKTSPQSPERRPKARPEQPADDAPPAPAQHQGATETDVTHTTPPVKDPADLVGETDEDDDEIDPAEELTPG
jgi:hypothetical protein